MANTITLNSAIDGREQFTGAFGSKMWKVKATIADQDAVAINDTLVLSVTVSGLALGDMVAAWSLSVDFSDGTDQCLIVPAVTAANTLSLYIQADKGELAADALNNGVFKALVVRPSW